MKFSVNKEHIINHFQSLAAVADKKQTLPILSNILIRCEEDKVKFLSTDLEIELEFIVDKAKIETPGEITISAKKAADIIRELPEGEVMFQLNDDSTKLTVKSSSGRYNLATISGSDFPDFDVVKSDHVFKINSEQLLEMFQKTSFAMGNGDWRHFLNGCLFEKSGESVKMVATDANRLSVYKSEMSQEGEFSGIIPRKSANEIMKILPKGDTEIEFYINTNNIVFMSKNFTFKSKLINANYPDYRALIPDTDSQSIIVNRKDLINTLSRVSVLTSIKFKGVKFEAVEGVLVVGANNPDQESAEEKLEVDGDVDGFKCSFNVVYLKEVLNNVEDDKITLTKHEDKVVKTPVPGSEEETTETKVQSVVIKTSDANHTLLIMPILV
tara:strand:- start:122 stop:1273 length:1152 start_codon:yes stop_codon:yes gene_type:complete